MLRCTDRRKMIRQDLRIAIRTVVHSRGLTAGAVATLGLAIGMASSVFTVVNAVLLRPLPYRDADRLAVI